MKNTVLVLIAVLLLSIVFNVGCQEKTADVSDSGDTTATLEIHFIDVGQADATLVMCDGKNMLIDGGNTEDSPLMYTYLERLGVEHLDYVVATHPHEDHVGGIPGAMALATVDTLLTPVTGDDSKFFNNLMKVAKKQNATITVPDAGDSYSLGSAEFTVLGCNFDEEVNNQSIVLKLTYGDTSFLFMGDAEYEAEKKLFQKGIFKKNFDLSADLLKVGHHGSNTSTSYRFLKEVMPEYAVISVGKDNDYGHPHDEVLSRLRDADVKVYRTDIEGDVVCTSDGEKIKFIRPEEVDGVWVTFVINLNSKKFHYPDCHNAEAISPANRYDFTGSFDALIDMGYVLAGCCD